MNTLAALGLSLQPDFLTESEEFELLAHIRIYMPAKIRAGVRDRNTVVRFGSSRPYNNMRDSKIPGELFWLCEKLVREQFVPKLPDSITINEYYAGQVIKPHIDHVDGGPVITVLSLATPATMVFTKDGENNLVIELPPRSLVQMRGAIRYDWQHEILPVKALRYSMVFRCSQ